jgi:hypothetical protein
LAGTKRGGGVAVNGTRHRISRKELATLSLKFLPCGRARWESFCLDFSCFVLFIKKKNEVGARGQRHLPYISIENNQNLY